MVKAIWNSIVIAESDRTVVVEGSHYFPAEAARPFGGERTPRWRRTAETGIGLREPAE